MDVVLVTSILSNTGRLYRPLGPYQLAWHLRRHGYEVQVLDFLHRLDKAKTLRLISKFIKPETKVFGWNCMFMPHEDKWWAKRVCEELVPELRRRFPQLQIVTGGAAAHDVNRLYRNRRAFDWFFYGHAEDTLRAFCDHVYRDKEAPPFEMLFGNRVIRENAVLLTKDRFDIRECDHEWHERDCVQPGESLPLEMGRGCIFKCKFCRYPLIGKSKNDFSRAMSLIEAEMVKNHDRFGATNYYMLEDTFNDSNDKINAFHAMSTKLPFRIGFAAYLRPDLLWTYKGQPEKLHEAGLLSGFLGVESLHPTASRVIGKAWSGEHARTWLPDLWDKIWRREVTFRTSLIVGLPPDRREDMLETHRWAVDNGLPNWKWHLLNINREQGSAWVSEFDRSAEQYGFSWYTEAGVTRWKTEQMTWREAKELQTELETMAKPYQMQDCWALVERGSYGYDLARDRHTKIVDLDKEEGASRRQKFLDDYYRAVSALPD